MANYIDENEGKIDFYNKYLARVKNRPSLEDVLGDNNDGVVNGNLLEFKLNISDVGAVLFQAIKYLSSLRIKGKSVPSNIVLVSLNEQIVYIFKSIKFLNDIEKVYTGPASKNNSGFVYKTNHQTKLNLRNQLDVENLIIYLNEISFTKINIDENCVIGWAKRFYAENKGKVKKQDFIGDEGQINILGEIRKPVYFKDYINPYKGKTNEKFRYFMDLLNDDFSQKDLGAYYTPKEYVMLAVDMVREAIKKVPNGNKYIILDRCAGTGNLQEFLTDEELSNCIVSTYEYYEYKVLLEILGGKVKHIIPPVDGKEIFNRGHVLGADALSKEFIENEVIKQYIDNPEYTIIMLENPPFAESGSILRQDKENKKNKNEALWKKSWVAKEMQNELQQIAKNNSKSNKPNQKNEVVSGKATNDLANLFIWSAFKYYLRQPTDSYILFSPIKYWKSQKLINKEFVSGYALNKKHFHATEGCIALIHWLNNDASIDSIDLNAKNIVEKDLVDEGVLKIKRVHQFPSKMFSSRKHLDFSGIVCDIDGSECLGGKNITAKKVYDEEIVGYLVSDGFNFDKPRLSSILLPATKYNSHGKHIYKDDFLYRLPLFTAGKYTDNNYNWKFINQLMKTADMKDKYLSDVKKGVLNQWLLKNLLWVCITNQSHMRSFIGSDGRMYRNELCLDKSTDETLATIELNKLNKSEKEIEILEQWETVLELAKKTKNYNPNLTYGVFQIEEELNTKIKTKEMTIYDYPELNGHLNTLRVLAKKYYIDELSDTLFKYELVK